MSNLPKKLPAAVAELFELHSELTTRALGLMERKNNDYRSGTGDPFKNFRGASTFDVSPVRGVLLRMQDKMCRIATFDEKGELLVKDEGVEDAIVDIINYAVLMAGLIREDKNAKAERAELDVGAGLRLDLGGDHRADSVRYLLKELNPGGVARIDRSKHPRSVRGGLGKSAKPGKGARR